MGKQAVVIGLGQFGMAVARSMSEKGMEVLVVDSQPELIRKAAAFTEAALCFDATQAEALSKISPAKRDVCICAIGDTREASIICTALLRQLGARKLVARANDPVHARILKLVGAHEVVNPESDFGERFASQLAYDHLVGELALGEDLVIAEIRPPQWFIGKTLTELALPRKYGITVVAVKKREGTVTISPDPSEPWQTEDIIVLVSTREAMRKFMESVGGNGS